MDATELDDQQQLRLRPVRVEDEHQVLAGQAAMVADDFVFALHHDPTVPFADYVARLAGFAYGIDLPDGFVPDTFLVAEAAGSIVGRVSIRHGLNDFLAHEGGHIGYGVLPEHRRKGYATEILRQALIIGRSLGLESALLTCDDDNVGSATVIERCAGELRDRIVASDGTTKRRYDIGL